MDYFYQLNCFATLQAKKLQKNNKAFYHSAKHIHEGALKSSQPNNEKTNL
jgi:hypothetical protein